MLLLNVDSSPTSHGGTRAVVAGTLVVIALALGIERYPRSVRWSPALPRWTTEVATWRRNPAHPLAIWPRGWTVELRPPAATPARSP